MPVYDQAPFEVVDANLSRDEVGAIDNLRAASLGHSVASMVAYGNQSYALAFSKGGSGELGAREQVALERYVQSRLEARNETAVTAGEAPMEIGSVRWLARMATSDVQFALSEAEKLAHGK